jgi:hypothetical protein
MSDAVTALLECKKYRAQQNESLKAMSTREKLAIDLLQKEMMIRGETCRALDDKWYLVLEDHAKKPKFTPDNIVVIFQQFLTSCGTPWKEEELNRCKAFFQMAELQLTTTEKKATVTDKKPVKLFLQKLN